MATDLNGVALKKLLLPAKTEALVPCDAHGEDWFKEIKLGSEGLYTHRQVRNLKHHKLLFAILTLVLENTDDRWPSKELLLHDLKVVTGLVEFRINQFTGKEMEIVGSISFESMRQDVFKRWFDRVIYKLSTDVLQCETQALVDQVVKMAGEPYEYGPRRRTPRKINNDPQQDGRHDDHLDAGPRRGNAPDHRQENR